MARFPEEAKMIILLRLPVKTLGQCKCVSKSWRSLISDPHFVKSHLNLAISDPNTHKCSRLFMMYPFHSLDYESPSSFEDVEDGDDAIVDLGSPPREPDEGVEIVGSSNGLICLLYLPNCFILWNPTIKDSKEVPTPVFSSSDGDLCFKGFGYNSSIDDYKVVRAPSEKASDPYQLRVEVFSLKANSWRNIEDMKNGIVIEGGDMGSCLNGALHWLGSKGTVPNKQGIIVSLDLAEEKFREILLPVCDNKDSISFHTLGIINGCLSLLSNEGGCRDVGIWVMKEYEVNWTKHIVLPQIDFLAGGYLVPLCFTNNGDVLIDIDGSSVVRYNLDERSMKNLKTRSEDVIESILYVESLISPNGYNRMS